MEYKELLQNWITFETTTGIKAAALVEGNEVVKVKLITKVGRMHYYSCLNDAGLEADELMAHGKLIK